MKDFAKSIVCKKKVGNYTPNYRYKGFLITNPEGYEFVVFLQDGLHVGYRGTTSKAQAEDWCDWHDPKTGKPVAKFRNSKTGNSKCGNAEVVKDGDAWVVLYAEGTKSKEFDSEAEAKRFAAQVGNSKVGNGITKFGLGTYVIADGHKAIVLGETVERGPNGIPFGWVTIRWVEGPWKGQSDQQYDYDLKKA